MYLYVLQIYEKYSYIKHILQLKFVHSFIESRIHFVVVRVVNLISHAELVAELWIQNSFDLRRMSFFVPPLNPAYRARDSDNLGKG